MFVFFVVSFVLLVVFGCLWGWGRFYNLWVWWSLLFWCVIYKLTVCRTVCAYACVFKHEYLHVHEDEDALCVYVFVCTDIYIYIYTHI